MKPPPFDYAVPRELDEALDLLAQHGMDAQLLAGGQSLVPMMALRLARPGVLIDLNRVAGLAGIARSNGTLRIGATTRQADILRSSEVARSLPGLAEATALVGHLQTRSRGTIGGSICLADPAAEYPAFALALDAAIELRSRRGARTIAAADFFTGPYSTALEPDEMMVAISFPAEARTQVVVDEIARRHGDFALIGAVLAIDSGEDGRIAAARLAWFGMSHQPVRALEAERTLAGKSPGEVDFAEFGRLAAGGAEPREDLHASAAYRRSAGGHLAAKLLRRALHEESR